MKLLSITTGALLASQAAGWAIYLIPYGCNEASTPGGRLLEEDNNNHECLPLPDDLDEFKAFVFSHPLGRCRISMATSADNCAAQVYTNTYDANYERGCFHVKHEWKYMTVAHCDHFDVPPI